MISDYIGDYLGTAAACILVSDKRALNSEPDNISKLIVTASEHQVMLSASGLVPYKAMLSKYRGRYSDELDGY